MKEFKELCEKICGDEPEAEAEDDEMIGGDPGFGIHRAHATRNGR